MQMLISNFSFNIVCFAIVFLNITILILIFVLFAVKLLVQFNALLKIIIIIMIIKMVIYINIRLKNIEVNVYFILYSLAECALFTKILKSLIKIFILMLLENALLWILWIRFNIIFWMWKSIRRLRRCFNKKHWFNLWNSLFLMVIMFLIKNFELSMF